MAVRSLSLTLMTAPARSFFRWWGQELFALLPAPLRNWAEARQNHLTVYADAENFTLVPIRETEQQKREVIPRKDKEADTEPAEASLVMDSRYALSAEFFLPPLPGRDLANAVELQVERQLPLKSDAVYYGFEAKETEDRDDIKIRLAIVRKRDAEDAVADMRRAGLEPRDIYVQTGPDMPPIGLRFSLERLSKRVSWRKRLTAALSLSALVLAGAILFVQWQKLGMLQADLASRLEVAQTAAADARRAADAIDASQKKWRLLQTEIDRPDLAAILAELSRRVPADNWISELQIRDNTIRITGYSPAPESLTPLLSGSPLFSDVRLNSVVPDSGGSSRFDMTMQKGPGGARNE